MTEKIWGKHYLIDCYDCNQESLTNPDNIKEFFKVLVDRIDMKAYGEPIIAHFAEHDPDKVGWTGVQLIETSLIDGHFVDNSPEAYISVHSCKDFREEDVKEVINRFFSPKRMVENVIIRR